MKKLILTLSIVMLATFVFGQVVTPPDSTKKEFKNALVIDATGLLQQFFHLNDNSYFYDPYLLRYKRFFKSNALRINVGGSYHSNDNKITDSTGYKNFRCSFEFAVGFEHYVYLSKRWNLYFGADAIFDYFKEFSHSYYGTPTYDDSEISYGYGVSPLLGVQFRINSRLSIATETSCDFQVENFLDKHSSDPASYYNQKTKSMGFATHFHAPTTIQFRIQL
jgi:hypothetical protein